VLVGTRIDGFGDLVSGGRVVTTAEGVTWSSEKRKAVVDDRKTLLPVITFRPAGRH